jgi:glycerol-3-phosphate dehydrogenase (NAD(P)+)
MPRRLRVTVLGDGGWGTTLALHLHRLGHRVTIWGPFSDYIQQMRRTRRNTRFLSEVKIPLGVQLTADLPDAVHRAGLIVVAVPSQFVRSVAAKLKPAYPPKTPVLSVSKGLDPSTMQRMSEVLAGALSRAPIAVLSGPNIAREIALGHPAISVIASSRSGLAAELQQVVAGDRFRTYSSTDVIGVELGGALKNPIAIAAGISDGLGFGANAKAALVTRGIVEMARLGVALGARRESFWGLSGLGDLVTTCMSGRNRWLGEQLGHGRALTAILKSTPMVIEGVETSRAALGLAKRARLELPIIEQVHAILFKKRPPQQALRRLMDRDEKAESV